MDYADGNKYEGDWKNDMREGTGVLEFINGDKYEGDWENDKRNGRGKEYE
jgi:hypothetical protein